MKKIRSIFLVLFTLFILAGNSYPQTYLEKNLKSLIKEKSHSDINSFILDKIENNRVMMIADEGHGNYIFMRTITNFLNYWIKNFQKDNHAQNIPRNLYLVLESDSNQINSIYRFFSDNNPYELLNPEFIYGYQFTSGIIEFYHDLRKIYYDVESINKDLSEDNKISLKLFGPEKVIDLNDWTIEKRDKYFINERDEYSSNQIISQLEKDTAYKAIIFYGGAHLANVKTQKLQNHQEQGYFIGYYLLQHFKNRGGFYSIDQVSSTQNAWLNECYKCLEHNYVIDNLNFDGCAIPGDMQPQFTDASIILFDKNINQPHISQIWSKNLIDCFFNNVDKFTNLKSEFNRGILASWIYYMNNISGNEFENINYADSVAVAKAIFKWKNWRDNFETNISEEIINQDIIKNKIKLFENSEYPIASRYEYDLINMLNVKVWYDQGASPNIKAKRYYQYIQNYSKPLIAENLINLLWVGTEEEKTKAIEYLKNTFSLDFNSAKEWMEWWRSSEYCN